MSTMEKLKFTTMPIRFVAIILFSTLVFSCAKESKEPLASVVPNNKVYIFIEPQSKTGIMVDYLKTKPSSAQTVSSTPFYGFFVNSIKPTNYTDFLNYIDMPFWYDGTLPAIIQSDIPQTSGGSDDFGQYMRQYSFNTIKINKGTLNEFGWVTVLIPVSALANDAKKLISIGYYAKNGTKIVSSGTNSATMINTNSMLYSYLLDYKGTRIPAGKYRIYSSHGDPAMRIRFNDVNDVYFFGGTAN
jgi:hypothetical protein